MELEMTEYGEDLGYLVASSISRRLLYALTSGRQTPTALSKLLKISLSNVSMKLKELEKRGLVHCINPGRRKGKIYIITEKGKFLLDNLPNSYKVENNSTYEGENERIQSGKENKVKI
jgi:DNA-binding MarR family transcriptional regulator